MSEFIYFYKYARLAIYDIYVDVYIYFGIHMDKQSLKKCPKVKICFIRKLCVLDNNYILLIVKILSQSSLIFFFVCCSTNPRPNNQNKKYIVCIIHISFASISNKCKHKRQPDEKQRQRFVK